MLRVGRQDVDLMAVTRYIFCIVSLLLIGCGAISFKIDTFFGLTLNSNITSVIPPPEFIDIFAENNLEMKVYGPKNPIIYSIFTETNASQITVLVNDTGHITIGIRERRFGISDSYLCDDLKSVLASLETIKSDYGASISQKNIENTAALERCMSGL